MKLTQCGFRITKIGKTAVSVAIGGLIATLTQGVSATSFDITNGTTPIPTIAGTTNSVEIYSSNNTTPYAGPISITLNPGVNLTGQVVVGGNTPWAIFTSKNASNQQWVRFGETSPSVASTLSLQGNNDITGIVGWNIDFPASNANTADVLDTININGTGVSFNNAVYANVINLNQGGTLQFFGNIDGAPTTQLNYNGHNATLTLHNGVTLDGNVTNTSTNGTLIFTGNGVITGNVGDGTTSVGLVEIKGNGSTVRVDGGLSTDRLDFQANATVSVGGNLDLNNNLGLTASNAAQFNGFNGVLQVGGNIAGVAGKSAITTTTPGTGTLTMVLGTQSITGDVGSSNAAIGTLNIGGTGVGGTHDSNPNASSNTTVDGNVFASTVSLNNNNSVSPVSSSLTLALDRNLTGVTVTDANGLGNLTLAGGTQTVTGTVGASGLSLNTVTSGAAAGVSTFTGAVHAVNVNNSSTGQSVFQGSVTAQNVGVNSGFSEFKQSLTATITTIGSGRGDFNTVGGSTASNIVFSGAGTANLNQGLTGTVSFGANQATVNLADGKVITGAISASTANSGILNAMGAATLDSDVGASEAIKELNINTDGTTSKTVVAKGHVRAQTISLRNDGVLAVDDGKNVTGTTSTTGAGTGSLTLAGSHAVTGPVGSGAAMLKQINAGVSGKTATFDQGVAYANTLAFSGNGTVIFNGAAPTARTFTNGVINAGAPDLGFVGTVDFGQNTSTGTLVLGNHVDLVTQHALAPDSNTQTNFVDANAATLRFAGNSVVHGQLGSATGNNINGDTFGQIEAGANGSTVTFLNDVYVSANTFHVTGTGKVNLLGDLNGPLVFDADGSVNVASGKKITAAVTTGTNGTGTVNFVGSATTQASMGATGAMLKAVNFHATSSETSVLPVTAANETVNIAHNVYALNTTIGTTQNSNANATTANIQGQVFLGNALTLAGSNVTLNTAGGLTAVDGNVDFLTPTTTDRLLNANGTISTVAPVTRSTTGTGAITTNGATLNFAIGTQAWADPVGVVRGEGGLLNASTSSSITGEAGSTLVMNGSEKVNLALLGSLRHGQTHTLIGVASGAGTETGVLRDNSFVIDTALSRSGGDLVVTASRSNDQYIVKSDTAGHFSNAAAGRLGTLAATGLDYSQDVQVALNQLDLNQWGFGNNQANLANQAKRLAPTANNSLGLTAVSLGSMATESIGIRMHELRNVPQAAPYASANLWMKNNIQRGTKDAIGQFDGYTTRLNSLTLGADTRPNNQSIVVVALSQGTGRVNQTQFRSGDEANLKSTQVAMYAAYDVTPELFVGGELSYGHLNSVGNRATAVGRTALFDFDGQQTAYRLDLGYRYKLAGSTTTLTPLISLEGRDVKQDAYTETNAGDIGLNVDDQRFKSNQFGIGGRLATTTYLGGMVLKPELTVMGIRERGSVPQSVRASYIGDHSSNAAFNTGTLGSDWPRILKVGLGVGVLMSKTSSMMVRYQHVQRETFSSNMAELTARWDF